MDETQAWSCADCPSADRGLVEGRLCNDSLAKAMMQDCRANAQGQIWWRMRKGRYEGYLYESSSGNCGWGRVFWTTDLEKYKTADLVWESKRRFGLGVRLKAINYYERSICYLFFLLLPSDLLIWLVSIITRFFFIGLVEVIGRRHFPWNSNDLIPSDQSWSEVGLKTLHPGPIQTALLPGMSRCHI